MWGESGGLLSVGESERGGLQYVGGEWRVTVCGGRLRDVSYNMWGESERSGSLSVGGE